MLALFLVLRSMPEWTAKVETEWDVLTCVTG